MKMKRLDDFISLIQILDRQGNENPEITGLEYDSRNVEKGSLFFALNGQHTDGHQYISSAIKSGASAVIYSDEIDFPEPGIVFIRVKDTRIALSMLSDAFYDHPSREMTVIGVTGTDGKSTTVSFIHQLLISEGVESGLLSTVNIQTGSELDDNPYRQSTPEASLIHKILRKMVDNGKKVAVVEATSHGLSPKTSRLAHVDFDTAVLTNVTHEHLEFHGTHEQYRIDKSNLFKKIAEKDESDTAFCVINADDDWCDFFTDACGASPVYLYSMKDKNSDLYISNVSEDSQGTDFTLNSPLGSREGRLNIPGVFNLENLMAALIVVSEISETEPLDLLEHVASLKSVTGRMTTIDKGQPFNVIVDYAHTPGSFEKLFPAVKKGVKGRLISVFGSAGERDIEKRSEQGEIADQHSDIIILTNEDPRLEDPVKILEDIASGIEHKVQGNSLFLIPDRKEAIEKALDIASEDDLVITLGKSHETSIIHSDGPHKWNEIEVVKELLEKKGFNS